MVMRDQRSGPTKDRANSRTSRRFALGVCMVESGMVPILGRAHMCKCGETVTLKTVLLPLMIDIATELISLGQVIEGGT
jgi:hypothetical protein